MNKKYLKYGGIAVAGLLVIFIAFYLYAFIALKHEAKKQGEVAGFKLFLDGVVIDEYKINPSIKLTRVYMHGMPWELLAAEPEYISIKQADIDADDLLTAPVKWPFNSKLIDVDSLNVSKTILQQKMIFTGSAKQTEETPLLLEFENDHLSGKAEIRIEDNQLQMIDISFDQADMDFPLLKTKRGSGWLSFSYEDDWQIVGELDAGITLLGPYQFFDSTVKINGPVSQADMTFSGELEQKNIVIDRQSGNYFVRQEDKTLPVIADQDVLQQIILTLDKAQQFQTATKQNKKLEKEQQVKQEKKVEPVAAKESEKTELPPPIAFKIQPVTLPEIKLQTLIANTALAGFIYQQSLVQVDQPCINGTGQCWIAHGQGGIFSYNPEILPAYFPKMKDYEQMKQLRAALLNFNVQNITVQGKDKTAQQITLKGTTSQNQPAEIQLSVLGLE
jgi:hypothetical protein